MNRIINKIRKWWIAKLNAIPMEALTLEDHQRILNRIHNQAIENQRLSAKPIFLKEDL